MHPVKLRPLTQLRTIASGAFKPGRAFYGLWYAVYGQTHDVPRPKSMPLIESKAAKDLSFREISFTFSVIALSARVACAGGTLSREKYAAFREAFPLSGGLCTKIRALFTLACENPTPFEHYVAQVKHAFPRRMALFSTLVDRLYQIATANGVPSREAEHMLARISHMLELSAGTYTDIRARYTEKPRAHDVLGVRRRTPTAAIKKRYHELMKRYHPDHFKQSELSPEIDLLLKLKISEINSAYRRLSRRAA